MTTENFKKAIIDKYMKQWIFKDDSSWVINEDWSVDVEGDVWVRNYSYYKLPFKFGKVSGFFYCNNNKLTTLENCPDEVGESLDCSRNFLTSLEHAPKKVGWDFWCRSNIVHFTVEDVKKVCEVGRSIKI